MALPKIILYCDHDFLHNSYFTCGLFELVKKGEVVIDFVPTSNQAEQYKSILFTTYFIIEHGKKRIRVTIDFHDIDAMICLPRLKESDVYYKVNYKSSALQNLNLPAEQLAKVVPFAPYWAARANTEYGRLQRIYGYAAARIKIRNRASENWLAEPHLKDLIRFTYGRNSAFNGRLRLNQYIFDGNLRKDFFVFYSPGCWHEGNDEAIRVNQERAAIIRQLKASYKGKAIVGFPENSTSREKYADCVFPGEMNHKIYVGYLKRSSVAIYSNGLSNCIPWRLGEYYAAGCVPLGEKIDKKLLHDPIGHNAFIEANNTNQIIENLEALAMDKGKLESMADSSIKYFNAYVNPTTVVKALISQAMQNNLYGVVNP